MFFSRVAGVLRKFEYEIVTGCTQTRRARTRIVRVLGLRTRACADATRRRRRRRGGALPWDVEETARFTRFCKARLFPKCSSRVVARGRFKDVTADGVSNTRRARPRAVHASGCNLFVKLRCASRYETLVHAYCAFRRLRASDTVTRDELSPWSLMSGLHSFKMRANAGFSLPPTSKRHRHSLNSRHRAA